MQSLFLCRFNGSFATTTCARQGDELISIISSERSLVTSCCIKSWSSLLQRLDLLAIGFQSGTRFENRDGSSIVAAEIAQIGVEFGIINSGFLNPNSMVTLSCSFWKSWPRMMSLQRSLRTPRRVDL